MQNNFKMEYINLTTMYCSNSFSLNFGDKKAYALRLFFPNLSLKDVTETQVP